MRLPDIEDPTEEMINLINPLMNTRVLKAHVDAAENAIDEAMMAYKHTKNKRVFAEIMARDIVTAVDSKTTYVVIVTETPNRVWVFGIYKSTKAAFKAMQKGMVGTREGMKAQVFPVIPAPQIQTLNKEFNDEFSDKEWD